MMKVFDEYDKEKLLEARKILLGVYEYNYGISVARKRLETTIGKIDYLLSLDKNNK